MRSRLIFRHDHKGCNGLKIFNEFLIFRIMNFPFKLHNFLPFSDQHLRTNPPPSSEQNGSSPAPGPATAPPPPPAADCGTSRRLRVVGRPCCRRQRHRAPGRAAPEAGLRAGQAGRGGVGCARVGQTGPDRKN